jgi:hypothetical protein
MFIKLLMDERQNGVMNSPAVPLIEAYRFIFLLSDIKFSASLGVFPPLYLHRNQL